MGYCYIWEFVVPPESVESFVKAYGADGVWAQLFRRSSAYASTQLLRDRDDDGRFLTVDNWYSESGYREFMNEFKSDYESLDQSLSGLATEERLIGHFGTSAGSL